MTPPLTVRSATRRFVVLTGLRWFPVGLTVPVMVLLATARGNRWHIIRSNNVPHVLPQ